MSDDPKLYDVPVTIVDHQRWSERSLRFIDDHPERYSREMVAAVRKVLAEQVPPQDAPKVKSRWRIAGVTPVVTVTSEPYRNGDWWRVDLDDGTIIALNKTWRERWTEVTDQADDPIAPATTHYWSNLAPIYVAPDPPDPTWQERMWDFQVTPPKLSPESEAFWSMSGGDIPAPPEIDVLETFTAQAPAPPVRPTIGASVRAASAKMTAFGAAAEDAIAATMPTQAERDAADHYFAQIAMTAPTKVDPLTIDKADAPMTVGTGDRYGDDRLDIKPAPPVRPSVSPPTNRQLAKALDDFDKTTKRLRRTTQKLRAALLLDSVSGEEETP